MGLDADRAVDRKRLKRRLTWWRILAVAAVVALAVALLAPAEDMAADGDHVARLDVAGLIVSDSERDDALQEIAEDDSAKALIVRIDSPGGTVVGGESLYRGLRRVAEAKPVVAVMRETATSAAYMTAVAADRVFAHRGSITGSIGVLLQSADITGLLDNLGIEPLTLKSGPLKAQPNPLEPLSEEAREATERVIADLHAMFVDLVAERRALSRDRVATLADGRIFTGRQALEAGLVDAIGGERQALDWLAETHGLDADIAVADVEIDRDRELWRQLLEGTIGKSLFSERLELDGLVSVWHPKLR